MSNLGFTLDSGKVKGVLFIFALYTVCIILMGLYVKYAEKRMNESDKLASFLNGGGNMGPIAVAMLTVTNMLSSGAVIGGPGLGYSTGFIWSITVYAGFMNSLFLLGKKRKKMAIIRQRTGMQTLLEAIRLRYESKTVAMLLGITLIIFLIPNCSAQLQGGAKLFAVVSGSNNYHLGLAIFAIVTILYTVSGGTKSLARVAVFQGVIMIISVAVLYCATRLNLTTQYGSFENAMRFVAEDQPSMVSAYTWTPLYTFGTALTMSFASTAMPNSVISTFTYDKTKTMVRAIIISSLAFTLISGVMSGIGPLRYAAIQTLSSGDYVNPYLTMTNLPTILAGLVVSGTSAAIQSTAASFMLIVATTLVKDIYMGCINPNADLNKVNRNLKLFTLGAGILAFLLAIFPTTLMQFIVNFSNGGMICSIWIPLVMGLYSKKVTEKGALCSIILGAGTYIALYFVTYFPSTASVYASLTGNCHPVIIGFFVAFLTMVIVSRFTPKVRLGTLQVWFSKNYDDRYAHLK